MEGLASGISLWESWDGLGRPLLRLLLGLSAGLFVANILEALHLTDYLAKIAKPLALAAHMGPAAGSAFALAFISPNAANGALSENYEQGSISSRELVLANLFNGLPASCMHMQTIFFLLWPVLGTSALIYAGIVLLAAACRTAFTILLGRCLLSPPNESAWHIQAVSQEELDWHSRLKKAFVRAMDRFRKRLPKLIYFTVPVYVLMYFCQQWGWFELAETWLADHLSWLAIVKPQAMGIIALQIVAETGASLGAASAVLEDGALSAKDVVIALLAGNVLATPMRAIRHQFPAYAGFFRPLMAIKLVVANQSLRVVSMAGIIWAYASIF